MEHRAAVMAFVVLSWLPPIASCDGSALTDLASYRVWTEQVVRTGIRIDPDGSEWDVATRSQSVSSTTSLSAVLPEPAVGGMVAWRVSAVDKAGNPSCDMEVPTP